MKATRLRAGRRLWLFRLIALVVVPLLVFGGIELVLRLAGYGYDIHYFRQVRIQGRDFYVPSAQFSDRFFPPGLARPVLPIRIAAEKSPRSYRIFLFGESAANGDPDPTYGVGRYLQVLLEERFPGTQFQVACVAITAIDSNVILPIARECARHDGDLWVIYMGNNEMVGPFGAETVYARRAPPRPVIRTILAIKATRIGQLLDSLVRRLKDRSSTPRYWGGMQMFMDARIGTDDPARLRAYANFEGNLEDILRLAQRAGVPVILSTVAVNLKDCPPFASLHAAGLAEDRKAAWDQAYQEGVSLESAGACRDALALYEKAAGIDPHFADLQFRMGRCELALTIYDQARRDFELARDDDALEFRADSRINQVIRRAASRHANQGVRLLDAANVLAQHCQDGIPGFDLFYEHVHLNFTGNYLLASNVAEQVKGLLPDSIVARDKGQWASPELCDRRLAVTVWDRQRVWQPIFNRISVPPFTGQLDHSVYFKKCEAELNEAKSRMSLQTPAQARQMYEEALARAPDDNLLHGNFERFLEAAGDLTNAISEARRVCELVPYLPSVYCYVGTLLVRSGNASEAAGYFSRALALQSDYAEAQNELGEILANQHQPARAAVRFRRAIRANPNYAAAWLNQGLLLESQGKTDAARESFEKAARLEPDGPADYFNRAIRAASLNRTDEAIALFQALVKAEPTFWQAQYRLGLLLAAHQKTDEAQTSFSEAIRYRPDFAPAHFQLGLILALHDKTDQAIDEFRTVLQLDPSSTAARQQIDTIKAALKRH
jgi:tetratricopeptide (TPR) repeat protein